jgi:hypothetical protein
MATTELLRTHALGIAGVGRTDVVDLLDSERERHGALRACRGGDGDRTGPGVRRELFCSQRPAASRSPR